MNLRDNIYITGYTDESIFNKEVDRFIGYENQILYAGLTEDIPEDIAKECVTNFALRRHNPYYNYSGVPQYEEYLFETAHESVQSACSSKYCIIHKKI